MARRFRYPIQGPRGPSAEEIKERELAENLATNTANIYRPPDAPQLQADPSKEIQRRLAMAFGYDPSDPPPLNQLLAKYHQSDPDVQAGMFAKGVAPVDAATGQKMLHAVGKNRSDVQEKAIDYIGQKYLSGDIVDETVDGKTQFFDMVTEEIEDPKNPLQTKKIKKKVPINTRTSELLNEGIRQGRIQDPKSGKWATESEILKPQASAQSRMSAEEFQKVLDLRATGGAGLDPIDQPLQPRSFEPRMPNSSRGNIFDPSMRPITPEEFGTPLYNPGTQRIPTPLTSAPAIASVLAPQRQANPGWLRGGGPQRLMENAGAEIGTGAETLHNMLAGGVNAIPRVFNAYSEWLKGDAAKKIPLMNYASRIPDERSNQGYDNISVY